MNYKVIDGQRYIHLGEFNHLRKNLIKDIYDTYKKDSNGQIHLNDIDLGQVSALTHIMVEILSQDLNHAHFEASNAEELRSKTQAVYDEVLSEWIEGRFLIVGKIGDKAVYYDHMEYSEDEPYKLPIFTEKLRLAETWTDHYQACNMCEYLTDKTDISGLHVVSAYDVYMENWDETVREEMP